jgi:dihydrofolate reductase
MPEVFLSMSMSLDGFIGENGMRLHNWLFHEQTQVDGEVARQLFSETGAVIVGWRTYIDAIHDGWGSKNPYGVPVFVVCRRTPSERDQIGGFNFVTSGIADALALARTSAGDKKIWLQGGANVAQQFLRDGLLDELHIHLAPILLGKGLRLFDQLGKTVELEAIDALRTPGATHLKFRVRR